MQNPTLLKTSNIYFSIAFIAAAVGLVYGILNFQVLQAQKQAIVVNEAESGSLATVVEKTKADFAAFGEERAKKQIEFNKKIMALLPPDENYTDLTRLFDNYFDENDKPGNPIFQSSLRYGKGAPLPELPNISVLPVSMNLEATRDNFFKFLNFVQESGSLETGTRLLEIKSIQLNFPEGGENVNDLKQKINFTVEMNAYYQTPKVER